MDRTNAGLQVKLSENAMEISGPDCPLKCNQTNGRTTFPEAIVFGKIQVLHGLDCPPEVWTNLRTIGADTVTASSSLE